MAFNIKRGRPNAKIKVRAISGFAPKGYEFKKLSRKSKSIIFKKIQ